MAFGSLRSMIRPLSRTLLFTRSSSALSPVRPPPSTCLFPLSNPHHRHQFGYFDRNVPTYPFSAGFHSLTDTRFPKRRPCYKPRRRRVSMRPQEPFPWQKRQSGELETPKHPNEGSVKRRNEKKRIKLRRAFILAEKKKRTAQMQEAKRKKAIKRVERKMAAVARERAWAQRLVELQQMEEEKKAAMAC